MRTARYLALRKESVGAFALRADVPYNTVKRIVNEELRQGPTALTCQRVILASRAEPAPKGGTITLEDLIPIRVTGDRAA